MIKPNLINTLWKKKFIVTLSHQSDELEYFIFFSLNAYWCSKSSFSKSRRGRFNLDWHIVRLVRYIGSYGIFPFSPPIGIYSVSPKKDWLNLNHQKLGAWNKIKCNCFPFWGIQINIIQFRIIYGWLACLDQ